MVLGETMKFCTIIDDRFTPGFVALLYSMGRYFEPGTLQFVLAHSGMISKPNMDLIARVVVKVNASVEFVPIESLGTFQLNPSATYPPRLAVSMQKLCLFKYPSDSPLCFLDADFLCVGNPTALLTMPAFTSTMVFGITLPACVHGRPMFSGGFFIFQPSVDTFNELQEFALAHPGALHLADQSLLNEWMYSMHPNDVHLLGIEWETIKRIAVYHPRVWPGARSKFIHFVGIKPWMPAAASERGFASLVKTWRAVYSEATK